MPDLITRRPSCPPDLADPPLCGRTEGGKVVGGTSSAIEAYEVGCSWRVEDIQDLNVLLVSGKQAVAHNHHAFEHGEVGHKELVCRVDGLNFLKFSKKPSGSSTPSKMTDSHLVPGRRRAA